MLGETEIEFPSEGCLHVTKQALPEESLAFSTANFEFDTISRL